MAKYIDRSHDKRGVPTEYGNRVDLDTALKKCGMDGLYGKDDKSKEKKELHEFVIRRANKVGMRQTVREATSGKLFNTRDAAKL